MNTYRVFGTVTALVTFRIDSTVQAEQQTDAIKKVCLSPHLFGSIENSDGGSDWDLQAGREPEEDPPLDGYGLEVD